MLYKNAYKQLCSLSATFLLIFFLSANFYGAPGDLDLSFGNGGKVTTNFGALSGEAENVAIQSDGKIVAVGLAYDGQNQHFALARYNTDGSLDTTFGMGGKVVTYINTIARAYAVAIQSDGKIVAAGYSISTSGNDFALARYNTNGSLDTTFGTGGIVLAPFIGVQIAYAVAIQPDGKIVAAGTYYVGFDYETNFALMRFNTNGSLDTSFGTGGVVITGFNSNNSDEAYAVAIQSDGKIVAAGISASGTSYDFALARYNGDGSLDTSFGMGGQVTTDIGGNENAVNDVSIQSDGKIVAAGYNRIGNGNDYNFALARYYTNGSLDNTFGMGGTVTTLVGESSFASAAAIQSNGKIVVAGYGRIGTNGVLTLARYNIDGSLDNPFGVGGKVLTPIGNGGNAGAGGVAIQPDGRIVAAGFSSNGTNADFALVRYQGGSNTNIRTRFDFDGDGRADTSVFRPSDRVWYLNQSTQGFSATQFGLSTDKITPADFDGDGKTDIAVFRGGTWLWLSSSTGVFNAYQFGSALDAPVPADYTGDGRDELAVYRDGVWWALDLSNGGVLSTPFGLGSDRPVAADYDGDGRDDQAVYRNGTWYINRSTLGFTSVQWGLPTDRLVPADYDGDGKADPAVYRDGAWHLNRSQNGYASLQFGTTTDVPTPADYDGDGTTDVAVFRPSDGNWYRLRSMSGFDVVHFGTNGDLPIRTRRYVYNEECAGCWDY